MSLPVCQIKGNLVEEPELVQRKRKDCERETELSNNDRERQKLTTYSYRIGERDTRSLAGSGKAAGKENQGCTHK